MAILIEEDDCFQAWQGASNLIHANGAQDNLVITVAHPTDFTDLKTWLSERNPKNIVSGADNIRHVINTIMPYGLAGYFPDRFDFYNSYKSIYLASVKKKRWGTYFQRLISFDKHFASNGINQLENAIDALNGGSPQRHYITFHLSGVALDSNVQAMGATCWHFGELTKNADGSINLIAIYRAQDYFNKGLGNFIGLGKLLEFICHHTNRLPGQLIVHPVYAFAQASKKNFAKLIA